MPLACFRPIPTYLFTRMYTIIPYKCERRTSNLLNIYYEEDRIYYVNKKTLML
ncbi:hypothetical protein F190043G2_23680 [Blautia caecimuris]